MRIDINEKYFLKTDPCNYCLCRVNKSKREDIVGYYPDFRSFYISLFEKMILASDAVGLKELVDDIEKFKKEITNSIKKIKVVQVIKYD